MAQEPNPYAPPKSPLADHSQGPDLHPDAGLWRRYFNNTIDSIGVQFEDRKKKPRFPILRPLEQVWHSSTLALYPTADGTRLTP